MIVYSVPNKSLQYILYTIMSECSYLVDEYYCLFE